MRKNSGQQVLKQKKYTGKINYSEYRYTKKEWILYSLEGVLLVILLGYFFYRSWMGTVLLSPLIFLFLKYKKKELGDAQRQELGMEFKDMLRSVSSSLQAGYSMENAFAEAYKDMQQYYGPGSIIVKELSGILGGIRNNYPVEELVEEMGNRSGVEDILDFAEILLVGKKSGGNMNEIMEACISVIEEKVETKQEIQTVISAKRLESKIMASIPFFIILYIDLTSQGYFDSLYGTWGGRLLMSICLVIYIIAVILSRKIINIEIL